MIGKLTTLAICLGCMVVISDQANAADYGVTGNSSVTKTAFFQPRPGGVLDVITSPFRPSTYNRGYQSRYGQSAYGTTNCVNGKCYTTSGYQSPCANGNCGVGSSYGVNYNTGNCPGGNCGVTRYQSPYQYSNGYRSTNGYSAQQYPTYRPASQPTYRPVSQPVYRPVSQSGYQSYRPSSTNISRNDPFFP